MMKRFVIILLSCLASFLALGATPQKMGRFVVGLPDYPKHLLHYLGADEYGLAVNQLVLEPLIELSPKTNLPEPRLAAKWKIENGGKQIAFTLHHNAKFHDKKPVTSKDVLFTWELIQSHPQFVPLREYFRAFEKCEAPSPHVFRCHASKPHFKNLEIFSEFRVLPQHVYQNTDIKAATATSLIGSGPYQISTVQPGERIILKRDPNFWAVSHPTNQDRFHFDEIHFRAISDAQTQFEVFKNNEIDYFYFQISKMWFVDTKNPLFEKGYLQKLKIENQIPHAPMSIAWNLRRPLFQDKRVRQALTHLMNREKWIQDLFYGAYQISAGPLSLNSDYHSAGVVPLRFDPKKARELLQEAGWKPNSVGVMQREGKSFEFELLSDSPAMNRFLTLYQEDLKQMGILMAIKTVDWVTSLRLIEEREFDAVPLSRTREVEPGNFGAEWGSDQASIKGSRNLTGYQSKKVDFLSKKIDASLTKTDRKQWIRQLEAILADEIPVSYLWEPTYFRLGYWNRFSFPEKGYYPYSRWRDAFHYWWFDPKKAENLKKAQQEGSEVPG